MGISVGWMDTMDRINRAKEKDHKICCMLCEKPAGKILCEDCVEKLRALIALECGNGDRPEAGPDEKLESTVSRVPMSREEMANLWTMGATPSDEPADPVIPCPKCKNNENGGICDWGDVYVAYDDLPNCPNFKEI